ncbi:MAG TPA: DNA-binding domain-containing protein [Thermoanaerobaculia bacterium]|nr:DNA-binding domain-containing protein [Thermoanaerobaculia bacterium]
MLSDLQQWMQAAVAERDADLAGAAERVRPSRTLDPAQRVLIYRGMYLPRMVEALETDYPALRAYLGEKRFHGLVAAYVERYPSRSYTLNRLGDHLPRFIAESSMRQKAFLRDLARLELAMTEVFDEQETPSMASMAPISADDAERVRFEPIAALRLLSFDHDVNAAFQAWRDEEPIRPVRGKTWLAVHRRDYAVHRMPLTLAAFVFLEAVCRGTTMAEAIESFMTRLGRAPSREEVFGWFRDWTAAGLFQRTEIGNQSEGCR